jgi:predicted dienelactone hydrolase
MAAFALGCGSGVSVTSDHRAASQLRSGLANPGAPGPYAVGHESFMLVDPSRNSIDHRIFVSLFYPAESAEGPEGVFPLDPFNGVWPNSVSSDWEAQGFPRVSESVAASAAAPFPLVLFSPGWGSRYDIHLFHAERLVSHGYVVAIVQSSGDGIMPGESYDSFGVASWNRPRDMSFTLDALLARNASPGDRLAGVIDPELVVASGHSIGGYAALTLAGGDDSVCDTIDPSETAVCGATPPDPRIKAVLAVDPASLALHWNELARIKVPTISTNEEFAFHASPPPPYVRGETPLIWVRQHAAISAHPNYRVEVANAWHLSFTNNCKSQEVLYAKGLISAKQINNWRTRVPWCTTATPQLEVARLVAQYQIAFMKAHLQRESGYQQILTPGWALTVEDKIEFFVTEPGGNHAGADCEDCFGYFMHQPGSDTAVGHRDDPFTATVARIDPDE